MMSPGTLIIITDAFPAHERGKAIGTWAGVSVFGPGGRLRSGGGFLVEHVSRRAIFYINLPVGVPLLAATFRGPAESRDTTVGRSRLPRAGILTRRFHLDGPHSLIRTPQHLRRASECLITLLLVTVRIWRHGTDHRVPGFQEPEPHRLGGSPSSLPLR